MNGGESELWFLGEPECEARGRSVESRVGGGAASQQARVRVEEERCGKKGEPGENRRDEASSNYVNLHVQR